MASNKVLIGAISAAVVLALALATISILYATGALGGHHSSKTTTTTTATTEVTTTISYGDGDSSSTDHVAKENTSIDPIEDGFEESGEEDQIRTTSLCGRSPLAAWPTLPPIKELVVWDSTLRNNHLHLQMDVKSIAGTSLHVRDLPLRVDSIMEGVVMNALQILPTVGRLKMRYGDMDYMYDERQSRFTQAIVNTTQRLSVTLSGPDNVNFVDIYHETTEHYNLDAIYERERSATAGEYEFRMGTAHVKLLHNDTNWLAVDAISKKFNGIIQLIGFSMTAASMEFVSPMATVIVQHLLKAPEKNYSTSWDGDRLVHLTVPHWFAEARLGTHVSQACYGCRLFITAHRNNCDELPESWADKGPSNWPNKTEWISYKEDEHIKPTWILVDPATGRVNASALCTLISYEEHDNGSTVTLSDAESTVSAIWSVGTYRLIRQADSVTANERERFVRCTNDELNATTSQMLELRADACTGRNRLANFTYNFAKKIMRLQKGEKFLQVNITGRTLNENDLHNFERVNSSCNMTKWQSASEFIRVYPEGTTTIFYSQLNLTITDNSLAFDAVGEIKWQPNGGRSINCTAGTARLSPVDGRVDLRTHNNARSHVKRLHVRPGGALSVSLGPKREPLFGMKTMRNGSVNLFSNSVQMKIDGKKTK